MKKNGNQINERESKKLIENVFVNIRTPQNIFNFLLPLFK